eukprot:jgi/Tetstr1/466041/TSEL_010628.t1
MVLKVRLADLAAAPARMLRQRRAARSASGPARGLSAGGGWGLAAGCLRLAAGCRGLGAGRRVPVAGRLVPGARRWGLAAAHWTHGVGCQELTA